MNKLRSPDENENNASSWLGFKKKVREELEERKPIICYLTSLYEK